MMAKECGDKSVKKQKVKLVCSDLDGTLLRNGEKMPRPELFDLVRRLAEQKIQFCPASGRQFASIRRLFEPVAKDCLYLCENGCLICDADGRVLHKTIMERKLAEQIVQDFLAGSNGQGEIMLSGERIGYLICQGLGIQREVTSYGYDSVVVERVDQIPEDILKVSLYLPGGVEPFVKRFVPRWSHVNAAVAGACWIDTTFGNKGTGVQAVCRILGIQPSEVMAFGDNFNDTSMLDLVGFPCLMNTAHPELRARYPHQVKSPEQELHRLLEDLDR
ncbi:MAG: HAD family hydrolase [Pygmaiobacter massiliensis]|nr:HAD family hydrolase [Pygmaiobacter massiliensis]